MTYVESELQRQLYTTTTAMPDPSCIRDLRCSSERSEKSEKKKQHQILNPLSEARDRTCILIVPSWIRFQCATTGTLSLSNFYLSFNFHNIMSWPKKILFFFFFLGLHPWHMEDSQAKGLIRAVAAGLHHSHSNGRSEPCLQPTPQPMATPDP